MGVPVPDGRWDVDGVLRTPATSGRHPHRAGREPSPPATDELDLLLDESPVPLDLTSALEALPVAEPLDLPMSGVEPGVRPGRPRRAGADPAGRPTTSISPAPSAYRCSRRPASWSDDEAAEIGTIDVVKQTSSMTGKVLKRPVRSTTPPPGAGQRAEPARQGCERRRRRHAGRPDPRGRAPSSRVRRGSGSAELPVGKHRVTLTYQGSKTVAKTMKKVTVRVVGPNH